MKALKTVELKTLYIKGLPVEVRKTLDVECHATQEHREFECKRTTMGNHCIGCHFCEIGF